MSKKYAVLSLVLCACIVSAQTSKAKSDSLKAKGVQTSTVAVKTDTAKVVQPSPAAAVAASSKPLQAADTNKNLIDTTKKAPVSQTGVKSDSLQIKHSPVVKEKKTEPVKTTPVTGKSDSTKTGIADSAKAKAPAKK